MYERHPITGMSCDASHPFPAPDDGDWIDSMEYGADERLPVNKRLPTEDRDTTPTWRMLAAWMWNTDCREGHIIDVAADPILTTHVIAVSALAYAPERADPITRLGFDQAGAGAVFAALNEGGLEAGRRLVNAMHLETRKTAIGECAAHILHGYTALQLDVGARFHGGQG